MGRKGEGPAPPAEGGSRGPVEIRGDHGVKIVRTRIICNARLVSIMLSGAAWVRAMGVSP